MIFPKSDSSIWHMYDFRYSGQLKMLTNKNNKKKAKKATNLKQIKSPARAPPLTHEKPAGLLAAGGVQSWLDA